MSLWWKLTCNDLQTTSASTSHDKVNHVNQKNSVKRQHSVNSNSSLTNFTAAAVLTKKPPSVITSPSSTGYETWNKNLGKTMSLTKCAWPRPKRLSVSKVPNKWQYGLWSFQAGGTKLERFLHKNQHTQRKLLNFEFWINGELSKIGHHISNKVF